jgi:rhodanese-related sulfurtransferase
MKHFFLFLLVGALFLNCNEQQETATITTKELKVLLMQEKIQLLDVRTSAEIKNGFIETAIFINYFEEDFFIKATKVLNKNKPVYLYCRSGNRSGKSAKILQEKGYNVYNVLGGYNQWKKEN